MRILRYGLLIIFLSAICTSCRRSKKIDSRISLWRLDRIPYGTKYAYDNLSSIFPNTEIRTSSQTPNLGLEDADQDSNRTLIILTPAFYPEPHELNSLIRFAAAGNQVFIGARYFADTVLNRLHLNWQSGYGRSFANAVVDSLKTTPRLTKNGKIPDFVTDSVASSGVEIWNPKQLEWTAYTYPGLFTGNYFDPVDTLHMRVLGRNKRGAPNFVRIAYAHGGGIYVHAEPLAFSNFFLLHKDNKTYYDQALSWMPRNTDVLEWSDYFRYNHQDDHYSALHFLLGNRSLRWAFWLTILLFLVILLVESKNKQKPIAIIPRLRNASEDFVKTVGRLYFQRKDNQNLAAKMILVFLENIRSSYNLPTSVLDDAFAHKLAFRTGRPFNEVIDLIKDIHDSRLKASLTDHEIMHLYQKINQFNKPTS